MSSSWKHRSAIVDPALMIRMLIVGYVFAIRSESRDVRVNLGYPLVLWALD
jgi:hypothetical protein